MKIRNMSACALATALGTLPLAYGAPPLVNGTQVMHFRTTSDSVNASNICAGSVCLYFSVQAFDDSHGVKQGLVFVQINDEVINKFSQLFCFGPAYANSVSVNQGTGNSTVSATVDPASSDCSVFSFGAGPPFIKALFALSNDRLIQ